MDREAITRRTMVGGMAAVGAMALTPWARAAARPLGEDVSEILMLGILGNAPGERTVQNVAEHVAEGRVGSVVFRKMNVGGRDDVAALVRLFSPEGRRTLLAIDHEGGAVQRLVGEGYTRLPRARDVAQLLTPEGAGALYARSAAEVAAAGFNLNLAPVVDLHDANNPGIGHFGRSYSRDPAVVAAYAGAFIDAFAGAGVACVLKHFPGEGLATVDSHVALPDITATWSEEELEPFAQLIASGQARAVMTGNVRLTSVDPSGAPVTVSEPIINGLLRRKLGFAGIAMTDDLDMEALAPLFDRREAVIRALAAGNDMLMVLNTKNIDPKLPQHVVEWIDEAIDRGRVTRSRVTEAADRVRSLRASLAPA